MSESLIYQIVVGLLTAGGIYGGIRADLKAMHQRVAAAEAVAAEAHRRLDRHLDKE